jgi:hypothetical protein
VITSAAVRVLTTSARRPGLVVAMLTLVSSSAAAQVGRLEVTSRETVAEGRAFGSAGPYVNVRGRVHGEIDPRDRRNRIIQDLDLAPRNAAGRVEYVATFSLMMPADPAKASGVLVYSVVNRGNGAPAPGPEGHVTLVSGWQGDVTPTPDNQTIQVPVARRRDGRPVTGPVLARFSDLPAGTSTTAIRIGSLGTAFYAPVTLDTTRATLTYRTGETIDGRTSGDGTVAPADWAFADCRTVPFPGTPDPSRICLRQGFDPARLYELVYTAKDPLVLGVGFAATRDIVEFFRRAAADTHGTPNPVAGRIAHAVALGTSQSGNFLKTFVHLGFNEGEAGRPVWDGILPYIAGRQLAMNIRFASPGGAAGMYEAGSEPALWWGPYKDAARGRGRHGLLERCTKTRTCPKVVEAFGAAEFWGLRMSPGLVGTDARTDIPLPPNVRRYYMPGTTHGGGAGGFQVTQPAGTRCSLPQNPNPMSDTHRALVAALVEGVTKGTEPPPSRYPTLARHELVAPSEVSAAFPKIRGVAIPALNPVLDYDFGSSFRYDDVSGVIDRVPPRIRRTIPMLVPRVDADGNEAAGVASPLHQAPLGTYLGWNVTGAGFFKGQICGFSGGYVPFAVTRAEREASGDPRRSIEERYGTAEGYTCAVRRAAEALVRDRYLLREDADRQVAAAAASKVLPSAAGSPASGREIADALCR